MYSCQDPKAALLIYKVLTFLGVAHIVTFVYQFSVSWLNYRGWRKKLAPVSLWMGSGFYLMAIFIPQSFDGIRMHSWGYGPQYGIVLKIFLVYFFFFFFMAFYNFVFAYFRSKLKKHKKQIGLMLIAFVVSFVSSTEYISKVSHIEFYPIGFIATFAWIVLVAYGLIRRQLFSVQDTARMVQEMRLATLGMMSASLSHEVKNPIYVMKGRAEMGLAKLADGHSPVAEEAYTLCQSVLKQSSRILEIIARFSRLAKGGSRSAVKFKPVDLQKIVAEVLPFLKYEFSKNNVELTVDIDSQLPRVHADEVHLEEVLINLIMNACQAMAVKTDCPQIVISAQRLKNNFVELTLKDNGPGMTEEQMEKLFEPFHTSKSEGMGLGLFITKQLMDDMGGLIRVESSLGQGASFTLRLKTAF